MKPAHIEHFDRALQRTDHKAAAAAETTRPYGATDLRSANTLSGYTVVKQPLTEPATCCACGSAHATHFIDAEDDLTGKPGRFCFVRCDQCALVYQSPRIPASAIAQWYDDEYIAHRKQTDFGPLTRVYNWAMDRHDRRKLALAQRYVALGPGSEVLDLGCGAGTFLAKVMAQTGARATGVDFKDLSHFPWMRQIEFRCGRPHEQDFGTRRFDLITLWHFLEHDYEPVRTLAQAREWLAPRGRMLIEVPRLESLSFRLFGSRWPGLQAPQHTAVYSRETLCAVVERAGLKIVEWLPWGAFPAYFYLFSGTAFKLLKGRGLNLSRAVYPYFLGELLLSPLLAFEKKLNLAMQTVVVTRTEP
jgi:SAM-dependent methyltransferase